jgi:hypothetical protein
MKNKELYSSAIMLNFLGVDLNYIFELSNIVFLQFIPHIFMLVFLNPLLYQKMFMLAQKAQNLK